MKRAGRSAIKGGCIALAMFGFGFALVPIYDAFCKYTGLNGKTDNNPYAYNVQEAVVDTSRTVTVQFLATNHAGMMWEFKPSLRRVQVHPGEVASLSYYVRNPTGKDMVGQAIPSVTPFEGTDFVHKTECFCFISQPLGAHEGKDMPLKIVIDPELPKRIRTLTLSYTLFDITGMHTKGTAARAALEQEGINGL